MVDIFVFYFGLTPNRSSAAKSAPSALSITQITPASCLTVYFFTEIKVNFCRSILMRYITGREHLHTNIQKNLFGSSTDNKCSRFHRVGDERPHLKIVSTLKDWQLDQQIFAARSKFRLYFMRNNNGWVSTLNVLNLKNCVVKCRSK